MMRIGLIADTHIEDAATDLPPEVNRVLVGSDLILHAGDIYHPSVVDRLERLAPVLVVAGNGEEDRRVADPRLRDGHVCEAVGSPISRSYRRFAITFRLLASATRGSDSCERIRRGGGAMVR